MDHFHYKNGELYAEEVNIAEVAARYGTPCYIYSRATLTRHWHAFNDAFGNYPHQICYAVKANSNLALLNILARLGAGFDIVSQGELERVLAAEGDPAKIIFSGVGKLDAEIRHALAVGIHSFNVESVAELTRVQTIAATMQRTARIALRINPDIDAGTHPYISTGLTENKFGITVQEAIPLYVQAAKMPFIQIVGISCHIGSQLTQLAPLLAALDCVLAVVNELAKQGIEIPAIDLGGGLGVRYHNEQPPLPQEYVQAILQRIKTKPLPVILEPGRALVANAGILVTRVEYLKHTPHKNFAIVDAGMNDLLRPSLYQAWQEIIPVSKSQENAAQTALYDVVGPVCETGDFLGKQRQLAIKSGDLLAVRTAGAYGFAMSSNYNSRPRAAEVVVDGDKMHLVRRRETIAELYSLEKVI